MGDRIPRLDWFLRPPGLIRWAAVYSAFFIDDTLHFVRTGPGWQRLSSTYAFIGDPVIEWRIESNRQALAEITHWDLFVEVPKRAEMSFPLHSLTMLRVTPHEGAGVTSIKLKASEGRPRRLSLVYQDYLGKPGASHQFFRQIPRVESR